MIKIDESKATVANEDIGQVGRPINYEVLGSELVNLLKGHLAKNSSLTINGFAERNGISANSLYYLYNSGVRKRVKADLVLKIACGVSRDKNPANVVKNASGEMGLLLKRAYQSLLIPNKLAREPELESYLTNKNAMIIALLAHNQSGTSRSEIKNLLDGFAMPELEKMLTAGVLKEDNGLIFGNVDSLYLDVEQTKSAIKHLMDYAKVDEVDKGQNEIKLFWGSLTPEGIKKRKEVTQKYIAELREVYNNFESKDGIADFTTITSDTITSPELGGIQ
jgi:hypothetical protein